MFCWELGGGLGHLMQMRPLAEQLVRRGHRVFVAVRLLGPAERAFAGTGVFYLQAPCDPERGAAAAKPFPVTRSFAHVLANVGWGQHRSLTAVAAAWRNLFRMLRPDLIVLDHSPTALLASRGLPTRRALIGSGFCCPPDVTPWAVYPPPPGAGTRDDEREELASDEGRVLGRVNRVLESWKWRPLDRLGQLYSDVDENFLTTFPELDHFPPADRGDGAGYWGPVMAPAPDALEPQWPEGDGPRVFAYLKASSGTGELLARLAASGRPTLAFVDGLALSARRRYEGPTLHLAERPVDIARAAVECDAAVLNGGHGVTAEMLLAGKPLLLLPQVVEQRLTAAAVARLGAGEMVRPGSDGEEVVGKLDALLTEPRYREAARKFATKYAAFNPAAQVERMAERVEQLVEARRPMRRAKVFAG